MSRSHSAICLSVLAVLMLASCVSSRKAEQRDRKKADRLIARAIAKYPGVLTPDSTTVAFHLPGDSAQQQARYTDPQIDSLLAACEQYAAALASERELYLLTRSTPVGPPSSLGEGRQRDEAYPTKTTPVGPPSSLGGRGQGMEVPTPQRSSAIDRIRQEACAFEPITATTLLCEATVEPGPNGPLLQLEQFPLDSILKAQCPPQVAFSPCEKSHVSNNWIVGFFILLILCIAMALILWNGIAKSIRSNTPQG
jgi:hypothetical protein